MSGHCTARFIDFLVRQITRRYRVCIRSGRYWGDLFFEVIMEKLDMVHPLITRDPVTGGELIVTRLECPESGIVIEGKFSLGWMARLDPKQLAFVELLVKHRGNIQKLAVERNVAYNTALTG